MNYASQPEVNLKKKQRYPDAEFMWKKISCSITCLILLWAAIWISVTTHSILGIIMLFFVGYMVIKLDQFRNNRHMKRYGWYVGYAGDSEVMSVDYYEGENRLSFYGDRTAGDRVSIPIAEI